jgi:DNA-binding transcriptional regulator GbsR (MarR family)
MIFIDSYSVVCEISVMTEINENNTLPTAIERFILYWGNMGGTWGVNRSVSQIHALLYVSERPLTAEEIADTLNIARSNVSNSLKELLSWNLIRRVPVMGDRRDHYEAEADIWELVSRIAAGRKERELDPALAALRRCVADAKGDAKVHPVAAKRLAAMLEFTELMDRWYAQMLAVPKPKLAAVIRLGARIIDLLPLRAGK